MMAFYSFLGLILQGALVTILLAAPAEGQNLRDIKVSVKAVDVTLEQAFQIIEQKTSFKFFYVKEDIPLNENATLIVEDESLYNILEVFAKDYGLTFNRINNQIVVKKSQGQTENLVTAIETGTVKGKVTDGATKEPLMGANVVLLGTTLGGYTDGKGNYEIDNVKPGKYTVVASYVGYSAAKKTIEVSADKSVEVNFGLGQSAINLDEVIVTGALSERRIRESANPITIIPSQDLEYKNLTSLVTLLQTVPGIVPAAVTDVVTFSGKAFASSMGSLGLRGYSPGSVKVILDGVEIASSAIVDFIDPSQIERIEVARGPMSTTLYGAGASNGVIQIFTKRGAGDLKINFKAQYTSQESKYQDANPLNSEYSLSFNGGKSDFGYNFGLNYYKYPVSRFSTNNGIDENDWSFSGGMFGRIGNVNVDLRIQAQTNTYGYYQLSTFYMLGQELGWKGVTKPVNSDLRSNNKAIVTSLNIKQTLSDNLYHNLIVSYSRRDGERNSFTPARASNGTDYYNANNTYSIMSNAKYFINWNQPLSDDFKVDLLGGFSFDASRAVSNMDRYTTPFDADVPMKANTAAIAPYGSISTNSTTAIMAEGVWGYQNNLFLTTGLRMEKNNSYGGDIGFYSIPRVGLTYIATLGDFTFKPRVSWGKSTQAVNPQYKLELISGTSTRLANPDLKPQNQSGYEFGADIFFLSDLSLGITYYDQQYTDLIRTIIISAVPYKYQYVNISKAYNKGLEISAKAIYNPFTLDIAFTSRTFLYGEGFPTVATAGGDPEMREGGKIAGIASGSFFAKLTYNVPAFLPWSDKGGSLSLQYYYKNSEYDMDNVEAMREYYATGTMPQTYKDFPGYSFINLSGNYSVLNNVVLFFDVLNLLNNQEINFTGPLSGRKITFGFSLKY